MESDNDTVESLCLCFVQIRERLRREKFYFRRFAKFYAGEMQTNFSAKVFSPKVYQSKEKVQYKINERKLKFGKSREKKEVLIKFSFFREGANSREALIRDGADLNKYGSHMNIECSRDLTHAYNKILNNSRTTPTVTVINDDIYK